MAERAIRIEAEGGVRLYAILSGTSSADALWESLPLTGEAQIWGDEVFFTVGLRLPADKEARSQVKVGEIGYWPEGPAIALFFGPTPASSGPDPVAASPVNIVGRITGDAGRLARVKAGARIKLTRLEG